MLWIAPGCRSAPGWRCPGGDADGGETFQPRPSSRAQAAPVPSVARPPPFFSPVKFSALMERLGLGEQGQGCWGSCSGRRKDHRMSLFMRKGRSGPVAISIMGTTNLCKRIDSVFPGKRFTFFD